MKVNNYPYRFRAHCVHAGDVEFCPSIEDYRNASRDDLKTNFAIALSAWVDAFVLKCEDDYDCSRTCPFIAMEEMSIEHLLEILFENALTSGDDNSDRES